MPKKSPAKISKASISKDDALPECPGLYGHLKTPEAQPVAQPPDGITAVFAAMSQSERLGN